MVNEGLFGFTLDRFGQRGSGIDDEFSIYLRKDLARVLAKTSLKEGYAESFEKEGKRILEEEKYSIPSGIYEFQEGSCLLTAIHLNPSDGKWISLSWDDIRSLQKPNNETYKKLVQKDLKPFAEDSIAYDSHNLSVIDHVPMFRLFDAWYSRLPILL